MICVSFFSQLVVDLGEALTLPARSSENRAIRSSSPSKCGMVLSFLILEQLVKACCWTSV